MQVWQAPQRGDGPHHDEAVLVLGFACRRAAPGPRAPLPIAVEIFCGRVGGGGGGGG